MCRVAVRQPPRNCPEDVKAEPVNVFQDTLAQFQAQPSAFNIGLEADEIDFENLFEDDNEPDLDAEELDLLALFSDDSGCATEKTQAQQSGAACAQATFQAQPANALPAVAPVNAQCAPSALQQLQMQALMQQQQQLASQQQQAYVAPGIPQDLAQLQQMQAAQMQAMLTAQAQLRSGQPVSRRGKTQAEVEEQQERIKKRRRESAQRSRARKNSYMKTLEVENKALKMENERLRLELMKMSQKTGSVSSCRIDTPSQHTPLSDHSVEVPFAEGLSVSGDGAAQQQMFSVPSTAHVGSFFNMAL